MSDKADFQNEIDTANLLHELEITREKFCADCGVSICGHEALMSLVMGFKTAPRCWPCLSTALGHDREKFRDHILAIIEHRICYYAGWMWANKQEGFESEAPPACLWPTGPASGSSHCTVSPSVQNETAMVDNDPDLSSEWDAGEMGCGDLVLELRTRLQALGPGQILKVLASDKGAPQDLPAWCRMTGNTLVQYHHPVYFIRRKG